MKEYDKGYKDGIEQGYKMGKEDLTMIEKKKDELQKENEELKNTNSLLFEQEKMKIKKIAELEKKIFIQDEIIIGEQTEIEELKTQIEKMKCCGNCKNKKRPETKESISFCIECKQLDKQKENIILTKWEIVE